MDCGYGHGECKTPETQCPHWHGTFLNQNKNWLCATVISVFMKLAVMKVHLVVKNINVMHLMEGIMDNVELLKAKDAIFRLIGQYCGCFLGTDDNYYMFDYFESALERSFDALGFDRDKVPLMEFCQAWEDNNRKLWAINFSDIEYRGSTAQEYYDIFVEDYKRWVNDNSEDAEFINREVLKNDIAKSTEPFNTGSVFRAINRQIAADVAPVRHGQWEPGNPICPVCGGDKFKDLDADIWCDWQPDFCPNCGAKMDEGKV